MGDKAAHHGMHPPAALGPDVVVAVEVLRAAVRRHAQAMRSHSTARTVSEREATQRRIAKAASELETAKVDLCDVLAGEP